MFISLHLNFSKITYSQNYDTSDCKITYSQKYNSSESKITYFLNYDSSHIKITFMTLLMVGLNILSSMIFIVIELSLPCHHTLTLQEHQQCPHLWIQPSLPHSPQQLSQRYYQVNNIYILLALIRLLLCVIMVFWFLTVYPSIVSLDAMLLRVHRLISHLSMITDQW